MSKENKIYLRVIYSAEYEAKYIRLQLMESQGYVDYIIVSEFDRTHTGQERELSFGRILNGDYFTADQKSRIIYQPCHVGDEIHNSGDNGEDSHYNERLFRGYFAKLIKFNNLDIIITCDADEIIFRRSYPYLMSQMLGIHKLLKKSTCYQLKLHCFFYRPDYLWENNDFIAPCMCFAARHKNDFPAQWRYEGKVLSKYVGCHFSWFLTIPEMIQKLKSYAHNDIYGKFADNEILQDAIQNMKYPFDPDTVFRIKTVDYRTDSQYFPDNYGNTEAEYEYLLSK